MASAFLSDCLHRRHGDRFITGFFTVRRMLCFLDFCLLHGACTVLPAAGAIACAVSGLMLYGTVWSEILRPICCIFAFEWMVHVRRTSCRDGERRMPVVFAGVLRRMSRNLFLVHMLFVFLFLRILRRDCRQPDLISTIGVLLCSLAASGLLEYRDIRQRCAKEN